MDSTGVGTSSRGVHIMEAPFETLPNLPQPLIPQIDLNIQRMDINAMLNYKPSIASFRRVGFSARDQSTQTDQTDIVDLHQGLEILQKLLLETGQLRREFNFAKHTLKTNYEQQIKDRATELYCRINEKLHEAERQNKEKIKQVRQSYQAQLDNAIKHISGLYKTYYDEILQGKTGHLGTALEELKTQVSEKDSALKEKELEIEILKEQVREFEMLSNTKRSASPPPFDGITQEEANVLYEQLDQLHNELDTAKLDLATYEDDNKRLKTKLDRANKLLVEEKSKFDQLKKEIDNYKKKVKSDQEQASKMAENRIALMEKEMKDKMESAKQEAMLKAQEEAEMQQMKERAKFQDELEKRKAMEEELLKQQAAAMEKPLTPADNELDQLKKIEKEQRLEINRLKKELEKLNKVWELKMAVMKKNFHALKNELHLRHTLERQSVHLQHATVGYASSGKKVGASPEEVRKLLQTKLKDEEKSTASSTGRPKGQSVQSSSNKIEQDSTNTRNVHFEDRQDTIRTQSSQTTIVQS